MLLAVGFGAGLAKAQYDGRYAFTTPGLQAVGDGRESQSGCAVSFSPDSKRLAVGHQDNSIVLLDASDNFTKSATITCHQAPVMALDWDSQSLYTVSIDEAFSMQFVDATSGVQIPVAAALKDSKWETQTTWLGWAVQGIQPDKYAKASITACDRSRTQRHGQHLLAVADSLGRVKVYHTPSYEPGHGHSMHRGHRGGVGNVRWAAEDSHLITVGGDDRCVFQWKVLSNDAVQEGDMAGDSGDDSEVERDTGLSAAKALAEYQTAAAEVFSAVKPRSTTWCSLQAPEELSGPRWTSIGLAHGVRYSDVRNAVQRNCRGGVVFGSAPGGNLRLARTAGVPHGPQGDIISMAMSASGLVVATGDCGKVSERVVEGSQFGQTNVEQNNLSSYLTPLFSYLVVGCCCCCCCCCRLQAPMVHVDALTGKCSFAAGTHGGTRPPSAPGKWLQRRQDDNHTVATYYSPSVLARRQPVAVVTWPTSKTSSGLRGERGFPLMIGGVKCVEFERTARRCAAAGHLREAGRSSPCLRGPERRDHGRVTVTSPSWDKAGQRCESDAGTRDRKCQARAAQAQTGARTGSS